jgi:hypothetical protein
MWQKTIKIMNQVLKNPIFGSVLKSHTQMGLRSENTRVKNSHAWAPKGIISPVEYIFWMPIQINQYFLYMRGF